MCHFYAFFNVSILTKYLPAAKSFDFKFKTKLYSLG